MIRQITKQDIEMFYLLENLKERSACVDKQVACIIVDATGSIIGSGVNTVLNCDKNCHDKEHRTCEVMHAERAALRTLYTYPMKETHGVEGTGRIAYASLFPCRACQEALLPHVDEIVTFGMIHKDWVSGDKLTVFHHIAYTLMKNNGRDGQRTIAAGELAELITAISDVFVRKDKGSMISDLLDEIVDVELQLDMLKIMAHEKDPEAFNTLRAIRADKTMKLLKSYGDNGVSSYGINT